MKSFVIGDELAKKIAQKLKWGFLSVEDKTFSDGEVLPRIQKEISIDKAILILSKKREENINSYILKFIFVSRKLRELSKKIIGIMPYFPYARQDKIFIQGQPLSSLYLAEILEKNLDVFITCNSHEHRQKISDLFKIPAYNFSLFPFLNQFFKNWDPEKTIVITPDIEAKKFINDFCFNIFKEKVGFFKKRDIFNNRVFIKNQKINLENKDVIIIDDIVSTGETLIKTALLARKAKCKSVSFAFIHLINEEVFKKFKKLKPKKIITTNTIQNKYFSLDISSYLAFFLKELISYENKSS